MFHSICRQSFIVASQTAAALFMLMMSALLPIGASNAQPASPSYLSTNERPQTEEMSLLSAGPDTLNKDEASPPAEKLITALDDEEEEEEEDDDEDDSETDEDDDGDAEADDDDDEGTDEEQSEIEHSESPFIPAKPETGVKKTICWDTRNHVVSCDSPRVVLRP